VPRDLQAALAAAPDQMRPGIPTRASAASRSASRRCRAGSADRAVLTWPHAPTRTFRRTGS
jgi:hypothetical protein